MEDEDFEGTLVLEKLVSIGKVEEFFEAVDSDNSAKARQLMRQAGIDDETIEIVIHKMETSDSSH